MQVNQVAAYCLMEVTSDPIEPKNIQTINKGDLYYLIFDAFLQSYGIRNRNRRLYDQSSMWESLSAAHIQELMAKKSWCGEAGHPLTNDVKRILTIDPKLISHKINSIQMVGNRLQGHIETLSAGYGKDMTKNMLQGMESAFSLRALAQIQKDSSGNEFVKGRSHVVCYDWVLLPSHMDAYQINDKGMQVITKSLTESGNSMADNRLVSVTESHIVDYIKEESVNVNVISNVFEVSKETMTLSEDLRHVILKKANETYLIKIEDKIKYDISSYMSKI